VLIGVDVIVFTAGVGENSSTVRAKVLEGLEFMGIYWDI
jgi:acetate kinase